MTLRRILSVPELPPYGHGSLLVLRLVVGIAFMLHGWGKIQNPFGWMGEDAFAHGVFQGLAAFSEFGGGLAWAIGLLTPLASLGIVSTMLVAIYVHAGMRGDPFVGGWELATVYLCIALVLMTVGPGRYSLDRKLFGAR